MGNKILLISAFALLVLLLGIQIVAGAPRATYTPPTNIAVRMYRLNSDGSLYRPQGTPFPCATPANRSQWGCTAFYEGNPPGAPVVSYPYGATPVPHVAVESDYLPDVVARELPIEAFHSLALQAQAIAARSYALNKNLPSGPGTPTPTPMDNSTTGNQAFVPYRFEFLRVEGGDTAHNPSTTPTPNPLDCDTIPGDNTARYQRKLCQALTKAQGLYLSHGDDTPIFAEFFDDALEWTEDGDYSYLLGIWDPISNTACDAGDDAQHKRGMSREGANRWAKGNQCAYATNGDMPWSVRWDSVEQILVHYYTGVHLRDASGSELTPSRRWNPLSLDLHNPPHNTPPIMYHSQSYPITVVLQNTGTGDWLRQWPSQYYAFSYRWYNPRTGQTINGNQAELTSTVSKGTSITVTLSINDVPNWEQGAYRLKLDMIWLNQIWLQQYSEHWFGDLGWLTYDVRVCLNGPCQVFLPLVMKNWVAGCEPHTGYWYPVGTNTCDPAVSNCAQGDGEPDGVWAGPWGIGYHQVEFTPQYVLDTTEIGTYWQTHSGAYGNLYMDAKLNGVWQTVDTCSGPPKLDNCESSSTISPGKGNHQ